MIKKIVIKSKKKNGVSPPKVTHQTHGLGNEIEIIIGKEKHESHFFFKKDQHQVMR
jgi:hypothetical protein